MRILILDSNSLVTPNERRLISLDSEREIKACRELYPIDVYAPRIVLAEVAHRRINQIVRDYLGAVRHLTTMAELIRVEAVPLSLSEGVLKRKLYRLFLRWCSENDIKIERPPLSAIPWARIVKDAIYRRPPFSAGESEKGFRDAIILETVSGIVDRCNDANITFVSRDGRLVEAASRRLVSSNVSVVETVAAYRSQLLLESEQVVAKRIETFTTKAAERFYTSGDSNSLFLKGNVISIIHEKFPKEVRNVPKLGGLDQLVFFPNDVDLQQLKPVHTTHAIGSTLYQGSRGGQKHEWKSRVVFVTLFEAEARFPGMTPTQFVREVKFDVSWVANVSESGDYASDAVDSVALVDSTIGIISELSRTAYSLPRPWERRVGTRPPKLVNISTGNPWMTAFLDPTA